MPKYVIERSADIAEARTIIDPSTATIGARFARALAARDAAALLAILDAHVAFLAVTPRRAWEADNAEVVVGETMLGTWFSDDRGTIDLLSVETSEIGSRGRVGYRFAVRGPDGDHLVEQQAYFDVHNDRITALRIVCSGFVATT